MVPIYKCGVMSGSKEDHDLEDDRIITTTQVRRRQQQKSLQPLSTPSGERSRKASHSHNTVDMVLKKPMVQISENEYDTMFAVNSKSAFFISEEAAKTVHDGGKIINIVTTLLAVYTPFYASYQGSKAPVEWITKALSKELMSRSISVDAIAPGPMDTPFFYAQENDQSVAFVKSMTLDGRLTKIEDLAPIVKFLCTDGAWISGKYSVITM